MAVHLVTFGYDHGDPPEADQVHDVRGVRYNQKAWEERAQSIADACSDGDTVAIGCKHGRTRSNHIADLVKEKLGKGTTIERLDKTKNEEPDMPMLKGGTKEVISENIREMRKAGHPEDQAVAAAYRMAKGKKSKKSKKPGGKKS